MSTEGVFGFRKNGVDKVAYHHSDSYPSGFGTKFIRFCARVGLDGLNRIYDNTNLVDADGVPNRQQVWLCSEAGFLCAPVEELYGFDWSLLLRWMNTDFNKYAQLAEKGNSLYMVDASGFMKNRYCEYAYIANLDEGVLEFRSCYSKKHINMTLNREPDAVFHLDLVTLSNENGIVAKMNSMVDMIYLDDLFSDDHKDFATEAKEAGLSDMEIKEAAACFAAKKAISEASNAPELYAEGSTVLCWRNAKSLAENVIENIYGNLNGLNSYIDIDRFADNLIKKRGYVVLKNGIVVGYERCD